MTRSIYVHVPFCASRCSYCSFCSSALGLGCQRKYFERLTEQIEDVKAEGQIKSIFFGGGTPSVVPVRFLCEVLERLLRKFDVLKMAEITLEANPGTVTEEKLREYKAAGFNRISFGGQSFDAETLRVLGRVHSAQDIFDAVKMAKSAGFDNINVDIILGAGKMDESVFNDSIQKLKDLGVTHFSAYILSVERGTKLFEAVKTGEVKVCDEDETLVQYRFVQRVFEGQGFGQYEISNFALCGKESVHNLNYWQVGEYFGLGLGAHSYINGRRWENTTSFAEFFEKPFDEQKRNVEVLGRNAKVEEKVMLSLRTRQGLCLEELKTLGVDLLAEKSAVIESLKKESMIEVEDGFLRIVPEFFVVSNSIIVNLI